MREFIETLPDDQAIVLSASCPAYGRSTTYKPLAEMLSSYPGGWAGAHTALLADPDLGRRAARSLASLTGQASADEGADKPTQTGVEEIAWAVRHLLDVISKARR